MRNQRFVSLLYGWVIILGLIFITSAIIALFLRFTSFNEPALSWVTLSSGLMSLFIGGLIAGIKSKEKGWMIGGLTGAGFTLFIFLVQYLGYQQGFSLTQSLHHVGFICAAIFGGIIGVNLMARQQK